MMKNKRPNLWASLYQVFIFGGIFGIVAVTIGTVALFDPQGASMLPVYTGGGCASAFLVGILAFWWIQWSPYAQYRFS